MALKLAKNFLGYKAEYWMITSIQSNKVTNNTVVWLSLYKDEATRRANIESFIPGQSVAFTFEGFGFTVDELYAKCKESVKAVQVDVDRTQKQVETNKFVNAEDC